MYMYIYLGISITNTKNNFKNCLVYRAVTNMRISAPRIAHAFQLKRAVVKILILIAINY